MRMFKRTGSIEGLEKPFRRSYHRSPEAVTLPQNFVALTVVITFVLYRVCFVLVLYNCICIVFLLSCIRFYLIVFFLFCVGFVF